MLKWIYDKIKKSNGFLTSKGKILNNVEWHAFGTGLMDGAMFTKAQYESRKNAAADDIREVKRETHYYKTGYFVANRSKWVLGTFFALGHV